MKSASNMISRRAFIYIKYISVALNGISYHILYKDKKTFQAEYF